MSKHYKSYQCQKVEVRYVRFGLPLMEKEDLGPLSCCDISWRIKADDWWILGILGIMGIITVISACAAVIFQSTKTTNTWEIFYRCIIICLKWSIEGWFLLTIIALFWKWFFFNCQLLNSAQVTCFHSPFCWSHLQGGSLSVQYHYVSFHS